MNQEKLNDLLISLTGNLIANNANEAKKLNDLRAAFANVIDGQDLSDIRKQTFQFENSDIARSAETIHTPGIFTNSDLENSLQNLTPDAHIFVRNTAVRSSQLIGGIPSSAAGARVNTFGPFIDIHGLPFFFDFVKVKKLIALYIQGQALPAILFDATFTKSKFTLINQKPIEITKKYKVDPESVWIQAKLLDPNAAADQYCGLRVKNGTITLDQDPFLDGNKLTISTTCNVECDLNLEQNNAYTSDPSSPFGIDARNANYKMPDRFIFSFKNNSKHIDAIGNIKWTSFGSKCGFKFKGNQSCVYNPFIGRLAIPIECDQTDFVVKQSESPFHEIKGTAPILNSWWALSVAKIDVAHPLEADGSGGVIIECTEGLTSSWQNLQAGVVALQHPFILGEPGRISFTDLASHGLGCFQDFDGWKDHLNPFGTDLNCLFKKDSFIIYNTVAAGDELIYTLADVRVNTDRPVKVNGEAVTVKTVGSGFIISANKHQNKLMLVDENMLWDNKLPSDQIPKVKPFALAMHNALFTVTPPNSMLLMADLGGDFRSMERGHLYLGFGLYSYLPTLPDPYAANLGILKAQFEQRRSEAATVGAGTKKDSQVWMWLISLCKWSWSDAETCHVGVSFHFAPLNKALEVEKVSNAKKRKKYDMNVESSRIQQFESFSSGVSNDATSDLSMFSNRNAKNQGRDLTSRFNLTDFSLLDVSSKANQMGVSYSKVNNLLQQIVANKYDIQVSEEGTSVFPVSVVGLDMVTAGMNAQAFTVPSISWEPVLNLTSPETIKDPPIGFNYYQNDGVATRIGNLSKKKVALSPIPLAKYLVQTYHEKTDGKTFAVFNLPFGMFAMSILNQDSAQAIKPKVSSVKPVFDDYVIGGIQLELTAGTSLSPDDSNMFEGFTIQLVNIKNANGTFSNTSTLAASPTEIFNNEFGPNSNGLAARPGVPVQKIGVSGYGASMFSNWVNNEALFAQVSQAQFNVVTGRTNHEVVQVKSVLYPWGIQVVRTITLFRLSNGYVARIDSGWQAQSDGLYDFSWQEPIIGPGGVVTGKTPKDNPFEFHPGLVRGIFNVRNIREQMKEFVSGDAKLVAVTFDADVRLENVSIGGNSDKVPSKGVLGYVQISPAGKPITDVQLNDLLKSENDTIGGQINCTIDVAGTTQQMKLSRFEVNRSVNAANNPIFVSAVRGSVVLPKDGSWSLVQHERKTGDVTPLPAQLSLPLIRVGKWAKNVVVNAADVSNLLRIAHPIDLLKQPDNSTINYGFLQNMGTQKVLFMTPGFSVGKVSILSKTPPLLADSFRLMNTKGIFPNVGNIENDFGQAISLLKGIDQASNSLDVFNKVVLPDAGPVFDVLQLKTDQVNGQIVDRGFKLAKGAVAGVTNDALKFDLPNFDYPLIDLPGKLVIKIQYKAGNKSDGGSSKPGNFDFNLDSFATNIKDTWTGRMNNLAVVVSLGPLTDVMTIKGNFNSQKGESVDIGSAFGVNSGLSVRPEIEFSDALEPVIKVLEILSSLSQGKYGEALKKGLQVAMSNSANVWEYKFEASKDIPLVRFPPTDILYNSPTTPLKLEASMSIGVFFNAALQVTTSSAQLVPTVGAYFKFHGGLQVMCVSLAAATIYAVGSFDLKLEADTSPKIGITMAFGFGAQLTVGLPVVGNVSVLYMVGIEVYADSSSVVKITAFMLFRGQADLLGGLVCVTITIEAKGSIEKGGTPSITTCEAQVTFAIDISIFLVIDISFSESWEESRQIA